MPNTFFRSEPMDLCHLLMHVDNAFDCMMELGGLGMLQFNNVHDEDHPVNGIYSKKLALCMELLRMVQFLEEPLDELGIVEVYYPTVDTDFKMRQNDIFKYERDLKDLRHEAGDIMQNYFSLEKNKYHCIEWHYALQKADTILSADGPYGSSLLYPDNLIVTLLKDQSVSEPNALSLNYIVASIRAKDLMSFELLLYRLFGRNLIVRRAELPTPVKEPQGYQMVLRRKFVLLMMTSSAVIRTKLLKCCQAYHVTIFECPETRVARLQLMKKLKTDIDDMENVLDKTNQERRRVLDLAAKNLFIWRINLRKAYKIFDILNRLHLLSGMYNDNYLQAECFVPAYQVDNVRDALHRSIRSNEELITFPPILLRKERRQRHTAPTYFQLNKFTKGFQNLIDSYGMADYREINPAPYTIITFPFLFAVMFGDVGHGILMTLFALLLICKEQTIEQKRRRLKDENEILNILFAGRYILLLMGLFSIYIGFIYNDVLSKSMNIFGSSWSSRYNASTIENLRGQLQLDPSSPDFYSGNPYPFGVDPIWKVCGEDSITTINSLKMKLAIILGICQMIFGLSLSAVNCIQLKRKAELFLVVIPQFIFMGCLFGYLVFLIFFKWMKYGGHKQAPNHSACAPSVLITFIDMMLLKSSVEKVADCEKGMFPGERTLEYILVFIAFATVPVLLAGKPIYLTRTQKKLEKDRERDLADLKRSGQDTILEMRSSLRYSVGYNVGTSEQQKPKLNSVEDVVEFEMSEIWIHSGIHTIESVLGSVSHTASYLRLWALSLAHEQLSDVLWHMVLSKGFRNNMPIYLGVPVLMLTFFIWAILTVAILVMMEGLSAFLHTLRLHWVEFQSKFFNGTGEKFNPFYFPPSTIRD